MKPLLILLLLVLAAPMANAQSLGPDNQSLEACEQTLASTLTNHPVYFPQALAQHYQTSGPAVVNSALPTPGEAIPAGITFGALEESGMYSVTQGPQVASGNTYGYSVLYGASASNDPNAFGVIIMQIGYTTVFFDDPSLTSIAVETGYDAYAARYGADDSHLCTEADFSQVIILTPEDSETLISISHIDGTEIIDLTLASSIAITVDDLAFAAFLLFGRIQESVVQGNITAEEAEYMGQITALAVADTLFILKLADERGYTRITEKQFDELAGEAGISEIVLERDSGGGHYGPPKMIQDFYWRGRVPQGPHIDLWSFIFGTLDPNVREISLKRFNEDFPDEEAEDDSEEEPEPTPSIASEMIILDEGTWWVLQPDGTCQENLFTFYEQDPAEATLRDLYAPEEISLLRLEAQNYYTVQFEEAYPSLDNPDRTRIVEWRLQVISPREMRRTRAFYQDTGDFVSPETIITLDCSS